ncbi:TrbL/VirB6 plasmid conjugal transfer protein [Elizabethkingia miricola]|nr:TrbL/VirB6 plasmid conjugal transfer protein [Elizabethkingia miricola]
MKTKYFTAFVCLIAVLAPMLMFGQTNTNYNQLLQFLKGDGAFEKWFMEVFTKLDTQINNDATSASFLGRSIGGFGALCYLGYLGWQMASGDRDWEVTPMLRPIFIGFMLTNWVYFTQMIKYPFEKLAEPSQSIFQDIEKQVNDVRVKRFEKQNQLLEALIKKKAEEDAKSETIDKMGEKSDSSWFDLSDQFDKLIAPIKEFQIRMNFEMQKLVADLIEAVALTILRVCTYLIFFIQKIWVYILITLGPIAVGISIIPGFESAMTNWVSKFINVNLYTFVAYTIINIGQQLIISGYQMEIDRYDLLIQNGAIVDYNMLLVYIQSNGMIHTVLFPCVAYIVTGIGVLMTPTIADTIVSAGGAGAMTKAKAAGGKIAGATVKTAKVATKVIGL